MCQKRHCGSPKPCQDEEEQGIRDVGAAHLSLTTSDAPRRNEEVTHGQIPTLLDESCGSTSKRELNGFQKLCSSLVQVLYK